jgi:hypothetical protein
MPFANRGSGHEVSCAMHADESAVSYFRAWMVKNFFLGVLRALAGIVPRSLVRFQPMPTHSPIFLSRVYAKLHNQFPFLPSRGGFYVQHSNKRFGLSVERFEPCEQTRSCIKRCSMGPRGRSSSRLCRVLVKDPERVTQLLH